MHMKLSQKMWMSLGILSIFVVALVVVQAAEKDKKQSNKNETTQLSVQFTTQESGGKYASKNVGVVWLSDNNGNYKSTLYIWGKKQKKQLKDWIVAKRGQPTDAVTGATRKNHDKPVAFTYDLPSDTPPLQNLSLKLMVTDSNKASKKHLTEVSLTTLTQTSSFTLETQDGFKDITIQLLKAATE